MRCGERLHAVDDRRLFVGGRSYRAVSFTAQDRIHDITKIDLWFLDKLGVHAWTWKKRLQSEELDPGVCCITAKDMGFLGRERLPDLSGKSAWKNMRRAGG